MADGSHIPVLLDETLELLSPQPGETAVDCTAGGGGHARAIGERLGSSGSLVLIDVDPAALARAEAEVRSLDAPPKVFSVRASFAEAARETTRLDLCANVVLADLGFSSMQMDDPRRGLSFSREGPLDMRLDPDGPTTAADLVNTYSEAELGQIIRDFGEDRAWKPIARKLVEARAEGPISTTAQLARIVRSAAGPRQSGSRIDPATRTFQALRIAVNDELGHLAALLESIERAAALSADRPDRWLASGARVGVISFHSLEDRMVKRAFGGLTNRGLGVSLTRRPVEAGESEVVSNPRARSARLRVIRVS